MDNFNKVSIIGQPVTALSFQNQVKLILDWANGSESRFVCVANVHMLMEAHKDPEFASILREADLVTPDGMPLVWILRRLGFRSQDRVAGMELLCELLACCEQKGISVFFVGSTEDVLNRIRARIASEYPRVMVAGAVSPPFRALSEFEEDQLISEIIDSQAQIVFVAFGCPKQERWMKKHSGKINAVMIGLGGAFPVFAGTQSWAPAWIRRLGLEWLYRLIQEPRRLWRRYWQTNLPFVLLAIQQLMKGTSVDNR